MDWLIQLVFLIVCLCVIWGFVILIRRSSRDNKTLRWLWILGIAIFSFLFTSGMLALMNSGGEVNEACRLWEIEARGSIEHSYCENPETRNQVSFELWTRAMLPPTLRNEAVCWSFFEAPACRPSYQDRGWEYYLIQSGIGLFFAIILALLVWGLTPDPRKTKEKEKLKN